MIKNCKHTRLGQFDDNCMDCGRNINITAEQQIEEARLKIATLDDALEEFKPPPLIRASVHRQINDLVESIKIWKVNP